MQYENSMLFPSKRTPWNKGKLIGAKPPLLARHVWSIRTRLQIERRTRDLAMFNLAIDSKLRGCDLVSMKVEDVAPNGYALARATVRQRKTGHPVRFELTEQTRQAVDDYLKATSKVAGEFLFTQPATPRRGHDDTAVCEAHHRMVCDQQAEARITYRFRFGETGIFLRENHTPMPTK
jgi:integrase